MGMDSSGQRKGQKATSGNGSRTDGNCGDGLTKTFWDVIHDVAFWQD